MNMPRTDHYDHAMACSRRLRRRAARNRADYRMFQPTANVRPQTPEPRPQQDYWMCDLCRTISVERLEEASRDHPFKHHRFNYLKESRQTCALCNLIWMSFKHSSWSSSAYDCSSHVELDAVPKFVGSYIFARVEVAHNNTIFGELALYRTDDSWSFADGRLVP